MTDKKQSAVARRLAISKSEPLYLAQRSTLSNLQIQVSKNTNSITGLGSYDLYLNNLIKKNITNISDIFTRLVVVEDKTASLPNSLTLVTLFVDNIDFNTSAGLTPVMGRLVWDSEYSTLLLGMNDVAVPIGQAMYKRIRNNTGNTLNKGEVVYVTGSHGAANLTVDLANANNEATAATTIGVVAEEILNNTEGFIITQGYLKGINTNAVPGSEGEGLWLDTEDGGFTTTRPTQPNHGVSIGWIVKKAGGGAGSIYVKITNGQELYELHDVLITSPADGEVLTWESATSLWKNKAPTGAITFTSSPSPPSGATYGDMWFDTTSGNIFVYITDGISDYWVEPFGPQGEAGAAGVGIANVNVNTDGDLIINLTNSNTINAGNVIGPAGNLPYSPEIRRWFFS